MQGDIEIMLGLQTVMKMMIEEIQADNKEKEEDLSARLTGFLVKGPPLEGMQAQVIQNKTGDTTNLTPTTIDQTVVTELSLLIKQKG